MIIFATLVLVAVTLVEGHSITPDYKSQIIEATNAGDLARAQVLLNLQKQFENSANPIAESVKNLKPVPGGHVYGEAESTYHAWNNVNGRTSTQSAGHKVINDDGRVTEFNFKPDPNTANIKGGLQYTPISTSNVKSLKPIQEGHVYGEAQKTFQSATTINGQTTIKTGGHKVINNDGHITEYELKPIVPVSVPQGAALNVPGQASFPASQLTPEQILGGIPISGQASLPGQVKLQEQILSSGQPSSFSQASSSQQASFGQVSSLGQSSSSGQVLIPEKSGQVLTPVQPGQSGQGIILGQPGQSGQVVIPGQSGQVLIPGQVAVSAGAPNVQSKYYTTQSNSKLQTVYTSGNVDNNPNLSQIKTVIQNKLTPEEVKQLQPIAGGQVFGEAENTYYTWNTVNGKTTVETHGHKVVNNNGKITEYDFKPPLNKDLTNKQGLIQTANLSADKIRNLKPVPGGHVYGEAENNFQTWSNINGQTFEKAGGHKVVNDDGKVTEFALQPPKKIYN